MTGLRVDASEVRGFATAMAGSPAILRSELATAVNATNMVGIGLAQEFVPVKDGNLRASITPLETASIGRLTAAYGPRGIIYARMREYGGVIYAKYAPFLVFYWEKKGRWVWTKKVRQPGSFYMYRSRVRLEPRFRLAVEAAVDRALARMGV